MAARRGPAGGREGGARGLLLVGHWWRPVEEVRGRGRGAHGLGAGLLARGGEAAAAGCCWGLGLGFGFK